MTADASTPPCAPIAAAGIICLRGDDVLLIRRGTPPLQDRWTLPGGRIEWGERVRDAALRELMEETGVAAEIIGLVDVVDAILTKTDTEAEPRPWAHYLLVDFAARWISGEPRAGDDAADARFFTPSEVAALGMWSETLRVIEAARAMARG